MVIFLVIVGLLALLGCFLLGLHFGYRFAIQHVALMLQLPIELGKDSPNRELICLEKRLRDYLR